MPPCCQLPSAEPGAETACAGTTRSARRSAGSRCSSVCGQALRRSKQGSRPVKPGGVSRPACFWKAASAQSCPCSLKRAVMRPRPRPLTFSISAFSPGKKRGPWRKLSATVRSIPRDCSMTGSNRVSSGREGEPSAFAGDTRNRGARATFIAIACQRSGRVGGKQNRLLTVIPLTAMVSGAHHNGRR
ncbi:hypothetical protein D3C81_1203400 [compost metagenome]